MTHDIKKEILDAIDVDEFWRFEFPDWDGDTKVTCPRASSHEDGDDSTESLSLSDTGAFRCFGCGWVGSSVLGYYCDRYCSGNFSKALAILYHEHVNTTIKSAVVQRYRRYLRSRNPLQRRLTARRGWTSAITKKLKIGWCQKSKRVTIPIFTLEGYCIDIRLHDSLHKARKNKKGKRIPVIALSERSVNMQWFPINPKHNPFRGQEIWCLEGEPDAVLATDMGLNCLTVTGGVSSWAGLSYEKMRSFDGKDVVVCFDNDTAGRKGAEKFIKRLAEVQVNSIKVVKLPIAGDFTDYILKHGNDLDDLRILSRKTNFIFKSKNIRVIPLALADTSKAEYAHKKVRTKVLVSGKNRSPFVIPEKLELECIPGDEGYCTNCPCSEGSGRGVFVVHTDDPLFLQWLYAKSSSRLGLIRQSLNLPKKCNLSCEVVESQNVEGIRLVPALTGSTENNEGSYCERYGFYLGHGLDGNTQYSCTAIPSSHPKTNESVLLIGDVTRSSDSITNFALDKEQVSRLRTIFEEKPVKLLERIGRVLSRNVTKIIGRPDLHTAVDLCYHSPLSFTFNGTTITKGTMELLLLGDTRCGKGQVAEGINRYYDLGAVVSGENCSFMGLVGGAQKTPDGSWMVTWGAFPLNHGRLVIVDEFSGLANDVLSRTSRVRSEGIAELDKAGLHAKTTSNTRTIWIANPNKGKEIRQHNTGVEAILELVATQEDVARFDLALIVAKGEVSTKRINKASLAPVKTKFTREVLRSVVLWAWSRKPEHISFTSAATDYILRASNRLARTYCSTIPLVQGENIRFKLAKLAASVAARCFSTPDGIYLSITRAHAKLAVSILRGFYDKPSMGYNTYSQAQFAKRDLTNKDDLKNLIKQFDHATRGILIDGLLEVFQFTANDMADWTDSDLGIARKYCTMLVRCNAVKKVYRSNNQYQKRPAFTDWLNRIKKKINV